jgi:hypothetical protein
MSTGVHALAYLPEVQITVASGSTFAIESLRAGLNKVAIMQQEGTPAATYANEVCLMENPFSSCIWDIVVSGGSTFATGTVTFATALANAFATGTAQCTSVIATDTCTVNGLTYTAVAGAKSDNTEFSIDTGDTACALDLADSIDNDTRSGTTGDVSAISATDTVTITTDVEGTAGNAITLAQTGGTITLSGAVFTGGISADTVTINGLVYTAVAGVKADDTEFSIDGDNTVDAADLADSISGDIRTGTLGEISAVSASAVVTMTSDLEGTAGNAVTLVSSDGATLAVSGSGTFTGGADAADYQLTFDSESITTISTIGRPALASRRVLDIEIVSGAYEFTVRSAQAVLGLIEQFEDKVASTGVGTTNDGTYTDVLANGPTPYNQYVWDVTKADNVYTLTPTANS